MEPPARRRLSQRGAALVYRPRVSPRSPTPSPCARDRTCVSPWPRAEPRLCSRSCPWSCLGLGPARGDACGFVRGRVDASALAGGTAAASISPGLAGGAAAPGPPSLGAPNGPLVQLPEPEALRQRRPLRRVIGRDHGIVGRQAPFRAVLLRLIFDSRNLQAFDRKHESALEKRRGTTFGVRLAGSGQAAGS